MSTRTWSVRRLHEVDEAEIDGLADVLIDCVEGGASVSFMHPLTRDRAVAFWQGVAHGAATGKRALLIAEDAQGLCGCVQLIFDLPENQPHRADVSKMLVHRRARRRGLGAALMRAAEATARECGKTLLVLDAVTGGEAARLYERLGWVRVGDIPNYALYPRGGFCTTTVYYRDLASLATQGEGTFFLRKVIEEDISTFFDQQCDSTANYMAAFTAKEPSNRVAFLARWKRIRADATVIARTIVTTSQVAGHVMSYEEAGRREVTYWLGKEYWGKGIATRALAEFLAEINRSRPIYARAATDNAGSLRVLEKCGFTVISKTTGFANARHKEIEELLLELR